MPIFEYLCRDCGHDFEALVIKASETICCPQCRKENLQKKMSTFAFKGSDRFVGTGSASGCSSCASHNCSTCH